MRLRSRLRAARNQARRSSPFLHEHGGTLRLGRHHLFAGKEAITAAEIAAAGRAAIFIPFGRATDSHQLRNAQEMSPRRAGAPDFPKQNSRLAKTTCEIFSLLDSLRRLKNCQPRRSRTCPPYAARDNRQSIEKNGRNVQANRPRAKA